MRQKLNERKDLREPKFLVACTRLYNPLCPSVGWSVGRSVTLSFFSPFYCSCPPARDFGSCIRPCFLSRITDSFCQKNQKLLKLIAQEYESGYEYWSRADKLEFNQQENLRVERIWYIDFNSKAY